MTGIAPTLDLQQILQRIGVGEIPPMRLSDVVVPTVALVSAPGALTHEFIAGADIAAGVGNFGGLQLENPTGSGRILQIRNWFMYNVALSMNFQVRVVNPTQMAAIPGQVMRASAARVGGARGEFRGSAVAAVGGTLVGEIRLRSSETFDLSSLLEGVELEPGVRIGVVSDTANLQVGGAIRWREFSR